MKIKSIKLKDFKRFTDLTTAGLPETAKLVVLWCELTCATEAEPLLNQTMDPSTDKPLSERRRFLQLPKAERNRILSEQAKEMADFYENDTEWREWEGGPLVEYDIPLDT